MNTDGGDRITRIGMKGRRPNYTGTETQTGKQKRATTKDTKNTKLLRGLFNRKGTFNRR
jgi:hypothetical protein